MGEITQMIKEIAKKDLVVQTFPAKVTAINKEGSESLHNPEDAYTVTVVRADGAEIRNVRLKASIQDKEQGFVCIPKQGSWVLVSIIEATETRAFISQYSEVERLYLRLNNGTTTQEGAQYFEMEIDPSNFQLTFKEKNEGNPEFISYKDIAKLQFSEDKSLELQFFNDEDEAMPITTANFNNNHFQFEFNETDGTTVLQRTTLDKEQVKVIFDEGYEALITPDFVKFTKDDLEFQMDEKFKVQVGADNLKGAMEELIQAISELTVTTPSGPSGVPMPPTQAALNATQMKFNQILK